MNENGGAWYRELNWYHWFVLIVCTLAWLFDCLDQQLFVLARKPAVAELLFGRRSLRGRFWPLWLRWKRFRRLGGLGSRERLPGLYGRRGGRWRLGNLPLHRSLRQFRRRGLRNLALLREANPRQWYFRFLFGTIFPPYFLSHRFASSGCLACR